MASATVLRERRTLAQPLRVRTVGVCRRDDEVLSRTSCRFGCPGNGIVYDLVRRRPQIDAHEDRARAAVIDHDGASEEMIADGIRGDLQLAHGRREVDLVGARAQASGTRILGVPHGRQKQRDTGDRDR